MADLDFGVLSTIGSEVRVIDLAVSALGIPGFLISSLVFKLASTF